MRSSFCISTAYDDYVSVLPLTSREYLDKVLDWDNRGVNKDLDKIAHVMIDWEEKLSSGLEIPYVDIQNLKTEYANKDILLRYSGIAISMAC